jgi:poly(3-hydroxybutyrate) depolymerase
MVPLARASVRGHALRSLTGILILGVAPAMMIRPTRAESVMPDTPMSPMPETAGTYDRTVKLDDGQTLSYTLTLPPALPRDGSQLLVLVLHYGGPPSGFYGRPLIEQLVAPALAELDAIFVAPVTLGGDWTNRANERAVFALYDELEATYATDRTARVVTGYSMGGVGTWHFISARPDYFMAAIPISGFKPIAESACHTPVYAVHSTADTIFDAAKLRTMIGAHKAAGCDVEAEFIDGVDHFNLPAFGPLIKNTVPWLRDIRARREDSN